jgi:hypothetical protein
VLRQRLAVGKLLVELLARQLLGPESVIKKREREINRAEAKRGRRNKRDGARGEIRFADVIYTKREGEEEEGPRHGLPVFSKLFGGIHEGRGCRSREGEVEIVSKWEWEERIWGADARMDWLRQNCHWQTSQ